MAIDFKALEKILGLAKKHKLAEIEIEDQKSNQRFYIKTSIGTGLSVSGPMQPKIEDRPLPLAESPKKLNIEEKYIKVLSPFVGTFYCSPSPDSDPYVQEGNMVKKGDVLCIVEAMKLMNEIESEINGKIISILAENGQPVEYGEPLFLVDPI